jgi:TrmH family RNA methyltransferase
MLSQNQLKYITALKVKKFREENNQFVAEGHKLVTDLVNSEFSVTGIYASAEWIVANLAVVRGRIIPLFETLPREMDRISSLSTPSPVLAVVSMPDPVKLTGPSGAYWAEYFNSSLALALDDIRDPGNLGTIIRIADWFGIETVICSENCVDLYNPKVVQATMGSIARVKVVVCSLAETIRDLTLIRGDQTPIPVYGTFLEGDNVFSQKLENRGIIVIGNESRGISRELAPLITNKLYIPSFGSAVSGKAESLNASIATAIICAEFRRSSLT